MTCSTICFLLLATLLSSINCAKTVFHAPSYHRTLRKSVLEDVKRLILAGGERCTYSSKYPENPCFVSRDHAGLRRAGFYLEDDNWLRGNSTYDRLRISRSIGMHSASVVVDFGQRDVVVTQPYDHIDASAEEIGDIASREIRMLLQEIRIQKGKTDRP